MHILLARYFRTFRNWMSIVYKYDYELMTWEKSTRQKWCISLVLGFRPHLGTRVDSCIGRQLHWDVLRHSGALSSSHFSSILDYDKYLIGSRHSRIIWSHRQTPREGTAKINYKCMCLFLCLCTVLTCFCAFYHLHWMWSPVCGKEKAFASANVCTVLCHHRKCHSLRLLPNCISLCS